MRRTLRITLKTIVSLCLVYGWGAAVTIAGFYAFMGERPWHAQAVGYGAFFGGLALLILMLWKLWRWRGGSNSPNAKDVDGVFD